MAHLKRQKLEICILLLLLEQRRQPIAISSVAAGFGRHGMPRSPPTLTFDRLTLKLVCESHLRWGTFLPNLGTLGLWVLELFAMYADGQTDEQTDGQKQHLLPPSLRLRA